MPVTSWDTTAALNTLDSGTAGSGGSISLDGAVMKPSEVDDAFRSIMAQIATFNTAAAFGDITLTSTDAGATAGPTITLYRNSATPAASDIIGRILFQGEDSAGNTEDYAEDYVTIADTTSTSEDASRLFRIKVAGTMTTVGTASSTGWSFVGAGAFTGAVSGTTGTFSGAGSFAGSTPLTLTRTDDGASGPVMTTLHDSASPAANDVLHTRNINGKTSAAATFSYLTERCLVTDPTAASEDSSWEWYNYVAGVSTRQMNMTATGMQIPAIGATTAGTGRFTTLSITAGAIITGTWTPTCTNVANVASATPEVCYYSRVGDMVHCSGQISIDPTLGATTTTLRVSLPIASALASTECNGTHASLVEWGHVSTDAANNEAQFRYTSAGTAAQTHNFTFSYKIV